MLMLVTTDSIKNDTCFDGVLNVFPLHAMKLSGIAIAFLLTLCDCGGLLAPSLYVLQKAWTQLCSSRLLLFATSYISLSVVGVFLFFFSLIVQLARARKNQIHLLAGRGFDLVMLCKIFRN